MFFTPTQKNFRKEMQELKKSNKYNDINEIYSSHKRTVKFEPAEGTNRSPFSVFLSIIITLILFIGPTVLYKYMNQDNRIINTISQTSTSDLKIISKEQEIYLKNLQTCRDSINQSLLKLSDFHKVPYQSRNMKLYKEVLIEGVANCEKWENMLAGQKTVKPFESLLVTTQEYANISKLAFKHYLDYINNKSKSDIEIANKYIEMVNQNNSGYFSELKKIMDENGYKYETLENGGIRYWVNSY
ncbi:MAG TPA: hypothetical protein GXX35_01970 [Thermoanaerobacterales bacterium]|nr:hypothetical protein [Thermoanaerobacterales bacterium]